MIVDELIAVLGYDLRNEQDLKKFKRSIDGAEKQIHGFSGGIGKFAAGAALAFAGFGAAAAAGISKIAMPILETGAQFEDFEARLTTLYEGNQEAAKQSLDWISKFAAKTPESLSSVTDAFAQLKAYGVDPIANESLRTLGDAASAINKPLMQAVEAFADASTGEFERLKEFGLRAKVAGEEVTFSWVENGKTISKTIAKSGSEIQKFLLSNWQKYAGAMERRSKTWHGMLSNMGDTWTMFLNDIGKAGFFDWAHSRLKSFLDYMTDEKNAEKMKRFSKGVSDALVRIGGAIEKVVTLPFKLANMDAEQMGSAIGKKINEFLFGVESNLKNRKPIELGIFGTDPSAGLVANTKKEFLELWKFLSGQDGAIRKKLDQWRAGFEKFSEAITKAVGLGDIQKDLLEFFDTLGTAKGLDEFRKKFEEIFNSAMAIDWRALGSSIVSKIWDGMKGVFSDLSSWWMSSFQNLNSNVNVPAPVQQMSRYGSNLQGNLERFGGARNSQTFNRANSSTTNTFNTNTTVNVNGESKAPKAAGDAVSRAVNKRLSTEYYNPSLELPAGAIP